MNRDIMSLGLGAWDELQPEINNLQEIGFRPSLDEMLKEWGPIPPEALVLGKASDGLPVVLNLHDPIPGPVLLVGDAGTQKTDFLRSVALGSTKTHKASEVQFGVITRFIDEWENLKSSSCAGIFPSYHQSSEDFILSLASWAHGNKMNRQSVLLLMDGLDLITEMSFDAKQNLRWLLLHGPARRVWPIITINPNRTENVAQWLDAFHTRIFGKMDNPQATKLFNVPEGKTRNLSGGQFIMKEGMEYLQFCIPEN